MKNDPLFKFVAAIVILGVIVALATPSLEQATADREAPASSQAQ